METRNTEHFDLTRAISPGALKVSFSSTVKPDTMFTLTIHVSSFCINKVLVYRKLSVTFVFKK